MLDIYIRVFTYIENKVHVYEKKTDIHCVYHILIKEDG